MMISALPWRFDRLLPKSASTQLAALIGLVLPLAAASLYRTYELTVAPEAWEVTRQLGLPFVLAELIFIICMGGRGPGMAATINALPRETRWALGIFLASFWVGSAFVSLRPSFSMALTIIWLIHFLFGAAVFHCVRREGDFDVANWGKWMAAGLAALVPVIAMHFLILPAELVGHERQVDWGSALPGFISSRLFGAWAGAVTALLLGLIWLGETGGQKPRWLYPAFALVVTLLIWSGTRAAVLGCTVAMLAAWRVAGRPPVRALLLKLPPILIGAAIVATLLAPYGHSQYWLIMPGDGASTHSFTSGRLVYWADSLRVFAQHPLFGTGAGSSWWLVPLDGSYHVQPHNAVVQFLLNWGVFATAAVLFVLGAAVWRSHQAAIRDRQLLPMVMMLDSLLVMSMFDGMLHFPRFVMLITACCAICLARSQGTATAFGRGDPVSHAS